MAVRNIVRNLLNPSYLPVMVGKMGTRVVDFFNPPNVAKWTEWARQRSGDATALAESLDKDLWQESLRFAERLRAEAKQRLAPLGVHLGGGGHYELLYFFTRLRRPRVVVETGVAAGFSSRAILEALERNGEGHLYSTDFPYFRLEDPERFIGMLVDDHLRHRWTLHKRGDQPGLAAITAEVHRIDLFHYDSDKRYAGRARAYDAVRSLLHKDSVLLMDDIQDDAFFHDLVEGCKDPWQVFEFEGKFLGLIGQ